MFNGFRSRVRLRAMREDNGLWKAYRRALRRWSGCDFGLYGRGNSVKIGPSEVLNLNVRAYGNGNEVLINQGATVVNCEIHFRCDNNRVEIGEEAMLKDCLIWAIGGDASVVFGRKATAERTNFFASDTGSKVIIGEDCMIASLSEIRCGDGHTIYDRGSKKILNLGNFLELGSHVWIATGVTVLKNVKIGPGSVIGARSIVTRDIPANVLAAGIPAKPLRENIGWRRETIYDLPGDWARQEAEVHGI